MDADEYPVGVRVRGVIRPVVRVLVATMALTAVAVLAPARPAGAQSTDFSYQYTAYGSAHCVLTNNHFMCERFDAYGRSGGHAVDYWLPAWCQLNWISAGNANGAPMRIQFSAPAGWHAGCYPGHDQSAHYGWHTGYGHYEGQHRSSGFTRRSVTYVGRDPNTTNAYGTLVEVW